MAPLKILISGGGVAGTALAFWLSRLNHDVTVVEHFPSLRTTGLQIDLRGTGITVMKKMGLEQEFRARAAPEEGMQFIDSDNRNRAYFPANKTGKGSQGITSDYEIMRGDLCRIIYNATGSSAKYKFGTSIASFHDTGDGLNVTFKNGDSEHYDLLVGCDGAFSSTRKMMFNASDSFYGFTSKGEYSAYLTYKKPMEKDERYIGVIYPATAKRSLLIRRHNPEEMQLYLILNRPDERLANIRHGDVAAEKAAFAEIFEDAGWKASELVQRMKDSEDFYVERVGIVKLETWSKGRATLLGDAASAPGGSGMGTSCALVGSYILAGEIGKHCGRGDGEANVSSDDRRRNIDEALKGYESNFRPFMDHIQKGLEKGPPEWLFPESARGIGVLHYGLTFVSYFMWITVFGQFFTRENIKGWELPEYENMPAVDAAKGER